MTEGGRERARAREKERERERERERETMGGERAEVTSLQSTRSILMGAGDILVGALDRIWIWLRYTQYAAVRKST